MRMNFQRKFALGLGSFIVVATGIVLAWQEIPAEPRDPGTILPLDQTVAVLINIDAVTANVIGKTLPQISTMPQKKGMSAAALLQKEDGTLGWVVLMPSGKSGLSLVSDDNQIVELLAHTKENPRLGTSATYVMLTKNCLAGQCAYVAFPKLRIDTHSPLGALFASEAPTSVEIGNDSLTLRTIVNSHEDRLPLMDTGPKDLFDHPLLILHVANFVTFARNVQRVLQPEPALALKTLIRASLAPLFGEDISPFYDLPPLLKGKTTLYAAQGSGTHLRIVLEGEQRDNGKMLHSLLQHFHEQQITTTVEKHTFDNRFQLNVMRQDESQINTQSGSILGWKTLSVEQKVTGASLFLALKGRNYILSNDQIAFEKAMEQEAPSFTPGDLWPAGLGLIDSKAVTKILKNLSPNLMGNLDIPYGTGGALKWRITQDGPRVTMVVRRI